MTQYFDRATAALSQIRFSGDYGEFSRSVDLVDSRVCYDTSVCSELDGFPAALRDRLNSVILRYSSSCRPVGSDRSRYESPADHLRGVGSMVSDLHDLFHELAESGVRGFSDDPTFPLRVLYSRSESRREELLEQGLHDGESEG